MSFFQLIGVSLGGAVVALLVKQLNPPYALYVSLFVAIFLTFSALSFFSPLVRFAEETANEAGIAPYAKLILRVVAIGFVTRVACDLCSDAGENAIAGRVELLGKGAVAVAILPVLKTLIDAAKEFLL